eukprot:gene4319-5044_t
MSCGHSFNKPLHIGTLPSSLTHLDLGYCFNQPITEGVLPVTLQYLEFGRFFDKPFPQHILSDHALVSLSFGQYFNQAIKPGTLPQCLESLVVGRKFTQKLSFENLPKSLTSLTLGSGCVHDLSFLASQAHSIRDLTLVYHVFYLDGIFMEEYITLVTTAINHNVKVHAILNINDQQRTISFRLLSDKSILCVEQDNITIISPPKLATLFHQVEKSMSKYVPPIIKK